MGTVIEGMLENAIKALVDRESELIDHVIQQDRVVDRMEVEIDEACHNLLALKQPTAIDMRFLVSVMKITSDLERMGDSAVNIVLGAREVNKHPPPAEYVDLPRLSEMTREMVRSALNAFVQRDAKLASRVCNSDDAVDALYGKLFDELCEMMRENGKAVPRDLHLLLIARNFERVADHATNIAEDVIYYVEGQDIRHQQAETGGEEENGRGHGS
ncbi:MAG: phosphate signaling complex protein PhoU, partial [Thermoanaerobaculia bacterium]|nr:phosphate signaling complex protein PhoU [Thermoanaerobaculia bacterium]